MSTEKELLRRKEEKRFSFKKGGEHKQKDPLTPTDLVRTVFHGDPKALIKSFGAHGRARCKRFLEDKEKGIVLKRSYIRNRLGRAVMTEETVDLSKLEKPKRKKAGK